MQPRKYPVGDSSVAALFPVSTDELGGNWVLRRRGNSGTSRSPTLTTNLALGVAIASKQILSLGCLAMSDVGNREPLIKPISFGGWVILDIRATLTLIWRSLLRSRSGLVYWILKILSPT